MTLALDLQHAAPAQLCPGSLLQCVPFSAATSALRIMERSGGSGEQLAVRTAPRSQPLGEKLAARRMQLLTFATKGPFFSESAHAFCQAGSACNAAQLSSRSPRLG